MYTGQEIDIKVNSLISSSSKHLMKRARCQRNVHGMWTTPSDNEIITYSFYILYMHHIIHHNFQKNCSSLVFTIV